MDIRCRRNNHSLRGAPDNDLMRASVHGLCEGGKLNLSLLGVGGSSVRGNKYQFEEIKEVRTLSVSPP